MPLNPPPNAAGVVPPAPTQDPPSLQDITNANEYAERLTLAKRAQAVVPTDQEIGGATKYAVEVSLANSLSGPDAPPWLGHFANAFNQLSQTVTQLSQTVTQLSQTVTQLSQTVEQNTIALRHIRARQENVRIGALNHRDRASNPGLSALRAKVKEVPGDGTNLANILRPQGVAPLAPLPDVPEVGNPMAPTMNTNNITHANIFSIVQFYNEDFGIEAGDHVTTRTNKINNWLTFEG